MHRPASMEELRSLVAAAPKLRVVGSQHSFNAIADAPEQVSLDRLPADIVVDGDTVSAGGAARYGDLVPVLAAHGVALANLASLPHISVAGAVATATHGSGERNGNLATAVAALELVTSEGEVVTLRRGDEDFDGAVVGLGALGVVTRISLDVEPAYEVAQDVFEDLEWEALFEHFGAIVASGYSVSVFTRWGDIAGDVWVKQRDPAPLELAGARPAVAEHHPIAGLDPAACTPQLGVAGPWSERLPHFRLGFVPSAGEEIQSEYFVPREVAVDALRALREEREAIRPLLLVSEIRTIAADTLWMSPHHSRDSVGIHFTWRPDRAGVERALERVEASLAPFAPRPHWGKLFLASPAGYERRADFMRLTERLDARGAFRNDWLERHVFT